MLNGCKEIAKYVRYLKETVMIGSLIVGALIGMMAGAITKKVSQWASL